MYVGVYIAWVDMRAPLRINLIGPIEFLCWPKNPIRP
jgi:hypothetical protein